MLLRGQTAECEDRIYGVTSQITGIFTSLNVCIGKVSTAQRNNRKGWIEEMTAVLLVLGWRGNGGSV